MFDKVTSSLLHQTDQNGTLIPVSRLNDSEKLKPLAVVIKCPGTRFWQRTKYKATDFTLNDLLEGKPIQPVLNQRVFLNNYEETKKGDVTGSGKVEVVGVSMKAQAHGTSKVLSSLGRLLKESVIMQPFLEDSKDRKLDHQHNLIMQLQGKNQALTFVKERIFTTCDCKINVSELKEGSCSALLNLLSPAKVRVYKSICLQNSRDVAIEIPPQTVMAYSVNELKIKTDGHYEVGVSPDAVEADELKQQLFLNETEMDNLLPLTQLTDGSSLSALRKELTSVKATLCELAHLSAETRFTLLNLFQEILPDQELLSMLEDNLQKICDEAMFGSDIYLPETSNELIDSFMDVIKSETDSVETPPTGPNGALPSNQSQSALANWKAANTRCPTNQRQLILNAMRLLISTAEELPNESVALIKTFSSETMYGLNELVTLLTKSSQRVPFSELPFPLRDGGMPEEVELLFILCNITLKRANKELYAEIGSGSKVLPIVLCVVIHGLAFLSESCETD